MCVFCVICLPLKLRNIFFLQISSLLSCKRGYFQGKPCKCVTLMNNIIASTKVLVRRSQMNDWWRKPCKRYKKLPSFYRPGLLSALSAEEDDHPPALISLHTTWPAWPGNQNMASTWMPSTTWSTPRAPPTSMASRRMFWSSSTHTGGSFPLNIL